MTQGPAVSYKVVRSERIREQLREWGERATELGLAAEYASALRTIEDFLTYNPLTWGDPVKDLKQMHLTLYRGLHWKMAVEYGVHEAERVVFIKHYKLILDNPLQSSSPGESPNGST